MSINGIVIRTFLNHLTYVIMYKSEYGLIYKGNFKQIWIEKNPFYLTAIAFNWDRL